MWVPCQSLLSILILTNSCKSHWFLSGKGNKSLSMSSTSHHKHMGGGPDRIEPVFIPVSPQPRASRVPRGMLQARLGAKKKDTQLSIGWEVRSIYAEYKCLHRSYNFFISLFRACTRKKRSLKEKSHWFYCGAPSIVMGTVEIWVFELALVSVSEVQLDVMQQVSVASVAQEGIMGGGDGTGLNMEPDMLQVLSASCLKDVLNQSSAGRTLSSIAAGMPMSSAEVLPEAWR